jgi:hypothetical protein
VHEQIFEDFRQYLDRECGLASVTIKGVSMRARQRLLRALVTDIIADVRPLESPGFFERR